MSKQRGTLHQEWYTFCPACGILMAGFLTNDISPCAGVFDDNDVDVLRTFTTIECRHCHSPWTSQFCGHCGINLRPLCK